MPEHPDDGHPCVRVEAYMDMRDEVMRLTRELAERDAKIAAARRWILNAVDPVAVGRDEKQRMLDALAPAALDGLCATLDDLGGAE